MSTRDYCNTIAMAKGIDPSGTTGSMDFGFAFELPLPWPPVILYRLDLLPRELAQLIQEYFALAPEKRPIVKMLFIAPDPEYSRPGWRRVMYYKRPHKAFSKFDKVEYWLPEDLAGNLIMALYKDSSKRDDFKQYLVHTENVRDLMICTHGSRDAACGKFGYPIYDYLRQHHASETVRVWRVNHFSGHIFAPTLLDMPKGDSWAFVDEITADMIANKNGDIQQIKGKYRGWAGADTTFAEAAEQAVMLQEGWQWMAYQKHIKTHVDAKNPQHAQVDISFESPDQNYSGRYRVQIKVEKHISTPHSTSNSEEIAYPQYIVTKVSKEDSHLSNI